MKKQHISKQHISKAGKELLRAKGLVVDIGPVIKALDGLMDALEIGRSESSTERLFLILVDAFSPQSVEQMMVTLQESHDDGLCYDMRLPIAESLLVAQAIAKVALDDNE